MDNELLIVILSQLPLVLYTIISGWMKFKSDVRKTNAEREASLGNAIKGAGETLEDAWAEIRNLRKELEEERRARIRIEKDLRRVTNYASQLAKQVINAGLEPIPFPPDSDPKIVL